MISMNLEAFPIAFCGCALCTSERIEDVVKNLAPELREKLLAIAAIGREWPEQRLAALVGGKHLDGKLPPAGIAAVELFKECVIRDGFLRVPSNMNMPYSPIGLTIDPDDLAATRAEMHRLLNFLPDGTPIDIEVFEYANAAASIRLVSPRARATWATRPEMFTVTDAELAALRAEAEALGFVVREHGAE